MARVSAGPVHAGLLLGVGVLRVERLALG